MSASIIAENIHQSYGEVYVLKGFDLTVEQGTVHGILGPNGAGKSTFIDLCTGSSKPTTGTLQVLGVDPHSNPAAVRSRLGIVMQETAFPTGLKVKDAVTCWKRYLPAGTNYAVPEFFDLKKLGYRRIHELSGGERRKLDLYLAMMGDPSLLVLDEPTTGLDPLARRDVWDVVQHLAESGTTILLTSHYLDEVSALCQQLSILLNGKLAAHGTPAHIAQEYSRFRQGWVEFSQAQIAHEVAQKLSGREEYRNVRAHECTVSFDLVSAAGIQNLLAASEYGNSVVDLSVSDYSLESAYSSIVRSSDDHQGANDIHTHEEGRSRG